MGYRRKTVRKQNLPLKALIVGKYGTQVDFAEEVGVDSSYVSMVIGGRRQLADDQKARWAAALGSRPEDLFNPQA